LGYQVVQGTHSAIKFQHEHPLVAKQWHDTSQYLVMLGVKDQSHLIKYIKLFEEEGLKHSIFVEPDIGHQITSVTVEPSEKTSQLCKRLNLLMSNKN